MFRAELWDGFRDLKRFWGTFFRVMVDFSINGSSLLKVRNVGFILRCTTFTSGNFICSYYDYEFMTNLCFIGTFSFSVIFIGLSWFLLPFCKCLGSILSVSVSLYWVLRLVDKLRFFSIVRLVWVAVTTGGGLYTNNSKSRLSRYFLAEIFCFTMVLLEIVTFLQNGVTSLRNGSCIKSCEDLRLYSLNLEMYRFWIFLFAYSGFGSIHYKTLS